MVSLLGCLAGSRYMRAPVCEFAVLIMGCAAVCARALLRAMSPCARLYMYMHMGDSSRPEIVTTIIIYIYNILANSDSVAYVIIRRGNCSLPPTERFG